MPLAVLIFEMIASFCGAVFFDPVPTWWHAAWVALVPGANAWLLRGGPGGNDRTKGAAAGFVLVTACFYGLLFLPLIHLSVIALIFVGLGTLSLTPIIAAIATWRIGRSGGGRMRSIPETTKKAGGWVCLPRCLRLSRWKEPPCGRGRI